jgi:hypothetical protein
MRPKQRTKGKVFYGATKQFGGIVIKVCPWQLLGVTSVVDKSGHKSLIRLSAKEIARMNF